MILGAHQSIAGGVHKAFARAEATGAASMQIFTKNARGWAAKPLEDAEARAFRDEAARTAIPVLAHDSYLINLASANPDIRQKSLACFTDEVARCEALGIPYLVMHPGANPDLDEGIRLIARGIDEALRASRARRTTILLEGTAGQGSCIGDRFEHLARILEAVEQPSRLALCLDTCHLYMAGYDIATSAGYERTLEELDDCIGLAHVKAFHLNDCKKPLGARVDRHEDIGKGTLGLGVFERLVNDARFERCVGVLETPGFEKYGEALTLLRGLEKKRKRRGPARALRAASR